jgi:hypothetical protein
MQILFVEESGTPPTLDRQNNTQLIVLGGVVMSEDFSELGQTNWLLNRLARNRCVP